MVRRPLLERLRNHTLLPENAVPNRLGGSVIGETTVCQFPTGTELAYINDRDDASTTLAPDSEAVLHSAPRISPYPIVSLPT